MMAVTVRKMDGVNTLALPSGVSGMDGVQPGAYADSVS